MRGCRRNDGRQMWRHFFCRRPLIEPRVGAAPHSDFAIAKRLLGQPFDDVVPGANERVRQMTAEKSGGAGDKNFHAGSVEVSSGRRHQRSAR